MRSLYYLLLLHPVHVLINLPICSGIVSLSLLYHKGYAYSFFFLFFLRWTDDLEEIIHYRLFIYIKQGGKILNVQYDDFDNYVCPCNHHS